MRKVELLPTRDCEAGYGAGHLYDENSLHIWNILMGQFCKNVLV